MLEMLELWVTYSRGEEPVLEKRCVFCRQQSQRHRATKALRSPGDSIMSLRCLTQSCRIWCLLCWVSIHHPLLGHPFLPFEMRLLSLCNCTLEVCNLGVIYFVVWFLSLFLHRGSQLVGYLESQKSLDVGLLNCVGT